MEKGNIYQGIVVNTDDPNNCGRVQVYIPAIHGDISDNKSLPWAVCGLYCEKNSIVIVGFENSNLSYPMVLSVVSGGIDSVYSSGGISSSSSSGTSGEYSCNVEKNKLQFPAPYLRITYKFGYTKEYGSSYHHGVDIGATGTSYSTSEGMDVVAAHNGTAHFLSNLASDSWGNYVWIESSDTSGMYTWYAHMQEFTGHKVGDVVKVTRGEILGKIGHTGNATGPHLHFEVRVGGNSWYYVKDPEKYLDMSTRVPSTSTTSSGSAVSNTSKQASEKHTTSGETEFGPYQLTTTNKSGKFSDSVSLRLGVADTSSDSITIPFVNKTYGLNKNGDAKALKDSVRTAFEKMTDAASSITAVYKITIHKGYVSYDDQKKEYKDATSKYTDSTTLNYKCAKQGYSEHMTGYGIDIKCTNDQLTWIKNNCYKYGFIIRYPSSDKTYTGFDNERHLRFLGTSAAALTICKALYNNGTWKSIEKAYGISSSY